MKGTGEKMLLLQVSGLLKIKEFVSVTTICFKNSM